MNAITINISTRNQQVFVPSQASIKFIQCLFKTSRNGLEVAKADQIADRHDARLLIERQREMILRA